LSFPLCDIKIAYIGAQAVEKTKLHTKL